MSDLISREALVNEIVNTQAILDGYNSAYQSYNSAYLSGSAARQFEILEIVKKQPTVNEQKIRNKAIDTFMIAIETHMKVVGNTHIEDIREIAEQLKGENQ